MPYAGSNWNILKETINDQLHNANTVEMIYEGGEPYTLVLGWDSDSDMKKALKWVLKKMKDIEIEDTDS